MTRPQDTSSQTNRKKRDSNPYLKLEFSSNFNWMNLLSIKIWFYDETIDSFDKDNSPKQE